jgi:hypothetical protein
MEYYGPLASSGRPRILGLTSYPLHLEANFGHVALRMEQLLDARVFGELDSRRIVLKRAVDRLAVSVLDYPVSRLQENPISPPEGQYHLGIKATYVSLLVLHVVGSLTFRIGCTKSEDVVTPFWLTLAWIQYWNQ